MNKKTVNKTIVLVLFLCSLAPPKLFAIGVVDGEVPLHDSLPVGGDLAEWGYLDVTKGLNGQPGADSTGSIDSTEAIQRTINAAYTNNMAVFFPSGTYLVQDKIDCWQRLYLSNNNVDYRSQLRHAHVLVGSTLGEGVTIRLRDSSPGFNNPSLPKSLFRFWCTDPEHPDTKNTAYNAPTRHYNAEMRNLKIDLGTGNSGAIAIWMQGSQGCNIQDVDIDINSGFAGIANLVGTGSGHAKITLRNGRYGIWCEKGYMGMDISGQPMPYLAGCRFINQSENAIYLDNSNSTLTLIGFRIEMTNAVDKKAIVLFDSTGETANTLNLVDGTIEMSGTSSVAVANDGRKSLNMENVYIKAGKLVDCVDDQGDVGNPSILWKRVNSYSYIGQDEEPSNPKINPAISIRDGEDVTSVKRTSIETASPSAVDFEKLVAMHLWKCDFPTFEDKDCYIAYELDRTGGSDVTDDLQGLINDHDKVFLPKGTFRISNKISLGRDKKLFGIAKNLSILKMDPAKADPLVGNPLYMVETVSQEGSQNVLAFLEFQQNPSQKNIASLHWRAGKQSIIRNIQQWYSANGGTMQRNYADFLYSGNGGGKLYNFHHTYSVGSDVHRPAGLRFEGVLQPTYVYGLSSEAGKADAKLHIVNSQNVYIVSYKDELPEPDYFDPQNPMIRVSIENSSQIGFYGLRTQFLADQTGPYATVIRDSNHITIFGLPRLLGQAVSLPSNCYMLDQDAVGSIPELTLDGLNALSKYELGSFVRDIIGSAIWQVTPTDDFATGLKGYWSGTNGFAWDASGGGRGKLTSGKLDYLGSANYDNVKIFYDFEDVTPAPGSAENWQVLRAKIRAQQDNPEDCYEVRLERNRKLRILAKAFSGSWVSVAEVDTGLADIQGTTHKMEILVKDEPDGDIKISVKFDTTGTANDKTLTWTHPADDTDYKRFKKGTIGFYSASSVNLVDNFVVKDGLFYND